jgi:hypothetical protein
MLEIPGTRKRDEGQVLDLGESRIWEELKGSGDFLRLKVFIGKCRIPIMVITKQTVADRIAAYLRHDISLADLVSWAEEAMMEGEFAEQEMTVIADVVSRLGVADVRAFGLAWEDCEQLLRQLGYTARVDIVAA